MALAAVTAPRGVPRRPGPAGGRVLLILTANLPGPAGPAVRLVCVHLLPPRPSWSGPAGAGWRAGLSLLPAPGDLPVILAGDFSSTLDHARFRGLLRLGYVDAASLAGNGLVPAWGPGPGRRPALLALDHVLAGSRCAVLATSVHLLPGSDHRALFAEVRLPATC